MDFRKVQIYAEIYDFGIPYYGNSVPDKLDQG